MGINIDFINQLNRFILSDIKPNFTFLNVVNQKNLIERLKKRKKLNRYDKFRISFYKKVQTGYLNLYNKNKKSYLKIDSNLEIDFNKKLILDKVKKLIK